MSNNISLPLSLYETIKVELKLNGTVENNYILPNSHWPLKDSFHFSSGCIFFSQEPIKWFHPGRWKDILRHFKTLLKIQLTVGWKLVKWPVSHWFHRHVASLSPFHRSARCQHLLLIYSPPPLSTFLPLCFLYVFDKSLTQICYCHREISCCFQPFSTSFSDFLWPFTVFG